MKPSLQPPKLCRWIFCRFIPMADQQYFLSSMASVFDSLSRDKGIGPARRWYWQQLFRSLPSFTITYIIWGFTMLSNSLKIYFRQANKHKGFTVINIAGLCLGMASCILILLYVTHELGYDGYHEYSDRIYRMTDDCEMAGQHRHYAVVPGAAAPEFTTNIPEIETYTRVIRIGSTERRPRIVKVQEKSFEETGLCMADSTFFRLFSYQFIHGDPESALNEPGSVVLTQKTAHRLFGIENPIGKMIHVDAMRLGEARVTAVIQDVPAQSHFHFNYLFTTTSLKGGIRNVLLNQWLNISNYTYFLLKARTSPEVVEEKMVDIFERFSGEASRQNGIFKTFHLQKLKDIHLKSNLEREFEVNGDYTHVVSFSIIAGFILLIACINFMNLSTARSVNRNKEVCVRKVFGAQRHQLVQQFMVETLMMTVLSMGVAILIVVVVLPFLNQFAGLALSLRYLGTGVVPIIILGMVVITGLLAGIYPSLYLSMYRPIAILRSKLSQGGKSSILRKVLVIFQFSISIGLIVSTLLVLQQIQFMKNQRLGFQKEQILVLTINGRISSAALKNKLLQHPQIIHASYSSSVPGKRSGVVAILPEGYKESETFLMDIYGADPDYIKTYTMDIVQSEDALYEKMVGLRYERMDSQGRIRPAYHEAYLVNETAAERMGFGDGAVGKKLRNITRGSEGGPILAVIKDYHHRSLKQSIEPLVIQVSPTGGPHLSLRITSENLPQTLSFIRNAWKESGSDRSLSYFFLNDEFDLQYRNEEKLSIVFTIFTTMSIVIACLGLLGLASFTAEQRTKEIGIRKVLGASVGSLVSQLSIGFIKWVAIANLVAWPAVYYLIQKYWLSQFPNRIDVGINSFLIAGGLSIIIALFTVGYRSITAASTNPVDTLRNE